MTAGALIFLDTLLAIERLCGWDIIGYCPYTFKIYELPGGKMYGNNGMFYENTKISKTEVTWHFHNS